MPWDLQSSVAGSLAIDSFGNTSMSPDRWILSSVQPQHIYSHLLVCTLVPWFPFSLSVGDLAFVNGIHQWPVIRRWTTMFDLDTSIHIVWHVLVAVYVEDLPDWWHLLYATSLWRSWRSWSFVYLHHGDSDLCILYVAMTTYVILILYHAYSWPLYSYVSKTVICIHSYV